MSGPADLRVGGPSCQLTAFVGRTVAVGSMIYRVSRPWLAVRATNEAGEAMSDRIADLTSRLNAYEQNGDADLLLESEAVTAASSLWSRNRHADPSPVVAMTLARYYAARAEILYDGPFEDDDLAAAHWYSVLSEVDPGNTPKQYLPQIERYDEIRRTTTRVKGMAGLALLSGNRDFGSPAVEESTKMVLLTSKHDEHAFQTALIVAMTIHHRFAELSNRKSLTVIIHRGLEALRQSTGYGMLSYRLISALTQAYLTGFQMGIEDHYLDEALAGMKTLVESRNCAYYFEDPADLLEEEITAFVADFGASEPLLTWGLDEASKSRRDAVALEQVMQVISDSHRSEAVREGLTLVFDMISDRPSDDPWRQRLMTKLGEHFMTAFNRSGDIDDLDFAIDAWEEAIEVGDDQTETLETMQRLHLVLMKRYEKVGILSDLDKAISVARRAAASVPDNPRARAVFEYHLFKASQLRPKIKPDSGTEECDFDAAAKLGKYYFQQYQSHGNEQDLKKSAEHYLELFTGEAYAGAPIELYESIPQRVAEEFLEIKSWEAYQVLRVAQGASREHLDLMVTVWRKIVAASGPWDRLFWRHLNDLSLALLFRFEATQDPADIEESVANQEAAIAVSPRDSRYFPALRGALGHVLLARYERFNDEADLDGAIEHLQACVDALPPGESAAWGGPVELAHARQLQAERQSQPSGLDPSIDGLRAMVAATHERDPQRIAYECMLATQLFSRFENSHDPSDCDESVDLCRYLLTKLTDENPARPPIRFLLGRALQFQFERTREPALLEEAILHCRDASASPVLGPQIQAMAERSAQRAERLRTWHFRQIATPPETVEDVDDVAALIRSRDEAAELFMATGAPDALDELVRRAVATVEVTPTSDSRYFGVVGSLADLFRERFVRFGSTDDINEAIRYGEALLAATDSAGLDWAGRASNLALFHATRFDVLGERDALNTAIDLDRRAAAVANADPATEARIRSNLAGSLQKRYTVAGDLDDLDDAVMQLERAQQLGQGQEAP